jgi:osmoprotectant transport system permease protein
MWALVAASIVSLPFLKVAPNRLVSGEPVSLAAALHGPIWIIAAALLAVATTFSPPASKPANGALAVLAAVLANALLWLAGSHASLVAETASPIARTSLGAAFWVVLGLLGLLAADSLQRLRLRPAWRTLFAVASLLPIALVVAGGVCDDLSIMKEYANRSDTFWQAVARHVQIVLVALVPTLVIGLPLGWLAWRSRRTAGSLFPVLNVIQTIPSIALFGLLMAPLAFLAAAWPALAAAGISGVGLAPGVIALTLYSLLPVVRGTLAGLEQVPSGVRDAARGMGMSGPQIFWRVDVPLAAPVVLAGIRVALVQSIGLAAVTALIGAGGLGAIMFEGLFASAQDLVLLGVLPIVLLGVLADAAFAALLGLADRQAAQTRSGTRGSA